MPSHERFTRTERYIGRVVLKPARFAGTTDYLPPRSDAGSMATLPVEVLYGIYLGVLMGIVPALVAWSLGFLFKYVTGVTVPGLAVVVLGVAIAGINGGLLALNDPTVTGSAYQIRFTVAIVVVLMMTLYAHSMGDKFGAEMPRKLSIRRLTERTLSTDVIELVGGRGEVRVTVAGDVGDIEGYPPAHDALREAIRTGSWSFPADLPLLELETRVADRLRTEYDLAAVDVRLDERARATVSVAPSLGTVSKRVEAGQRAVSVPTLVPTGMARGDHVTVAAGDDRYRGTVVAASSGGKTREPGEEKPTGAPATDGESESSGTTPAATTTSGGEGRVTLAVERTVAPELLDADPDRLEVRSRGTRREFELVALLRRAGKRFRKLTVAEDGPLAGTTLGESAVRDTYGVAVLAVRHEGSWVLAPRGSQAVTAGDELFAVGTRDALADFVGVVA
jgi:hypothetical protein